MLQTNASEPVILSAHHFPEITCVCRVVHIVAECDVCGKVVTDGLHAPEVCHGFFCTRCCICRTYRPSEDELRAMERNRARLEERQEKGAGPKPRRVQAASERPVKAARRVRAASKRPVNPARRAAALRQWGDPAARRKIVAGIRRGKRAGR